VPGRQFSIAGVLALLDMNDHALAVNIGDLQLRRFGTPQTGRVQQHDDGLVADARRGFD
jgi:hypothetical protein